MNIVKLECVSDDSGTDTDLSSVLDAMSMQSVLGGWVWGIMSVPGTGDDEPSAAFNVDLQDKHDFSWIDENAVSEAAVSWLSGAGAASGQYPIITKGTAFVCSTLGDGKKADFYIWVLKG